MRLPAILVTLGLTALGLAACASPPGPLTNQPLDDGFAQFTTGLPGPGPEFGVAGAIPSQLAASGGAAKSPGEIAMRHAAQICTRGYETVEQGTAPGEPVEFAIARVRCNSYRPTF